MKVGGSRVARVSICTMPITSPPRSTGAASASTPSGTPLEAELGRAGRPLGPLAVALDRGAQLLAEVVERLLVALQPTRRRLDALVRRGGRGGEHGCLRSRPPGWRPPRGGRRRSLRPPCGRPRPRRLWALGPAPARPPRSRPPAPCRLRQGGSAAAAGAASRTLPPLARSTTAARAERVTRARRSARSRRSAVCAPARSTAPSPTASRAARPRPIRNRRRCETGRASAARSYPWPWRVFS